MFERKPMHQEESEVQLDIIVTPMLDMAFQLLAFFVMTYHPSALEGHIDGTLMPPSKIAAKGKGAGDVAGKMKPDEDPPIPAATEPDEKEEVSIIVKAVPKGQTLDNNHLDGSPTRIMMRTKAAPEERIIVDERFDFREGLKELKKKLDEVRTGLGEGTRAVVSIAPDRDLKHGYFIAIYDVCKAARFESVNFVQPPVELKAGATEPRNP